MNRELGWILPGTAWGNQKRQRYGSTSVLSPEAGFRCRYCQAYIHSIPWISGVQNRNHCPYCLRSRHLDLKHAGDRLSACKALMLPIGLTLKQCRDKYGKKIAGELMLVHRCSECNKVTINRVAADDSVDGLLIALEFSDGLDISTRADLREGGIHLLQSTDAMLITEQLYGRSI